MLIMFQKNIYEKISAPILTFTSQLQYPLLFFFLIHPAYFWLCSMTFNLGVPYSIVRGHSK